MQNKVWNFDLPSNHYIFWITVLTKLLDTMHYIGEPSNVKKHLSVKVHSSHLSQWFGVVSEFPFINILAKHVRLQLAEVRCACGTHFGSSCDVHACGAFTGLRSVTAILHNFLAIMKELMIEICFLLVLVTNCVAQKWRILAIFHKI